MAYSGDAYEKQRGVEERILGKGCCWERDVVMHNYCLHVGASEFLRSLREGR